MKIGILALQGGFEAHAKVLEKLRVSWGYVRTPAELNTVSAMILPGGESSTQLKLMQECGLWEALQLAVKAQMPFFGTCAGAILLAKKVQSPEQASLAAVDISITRNAYGRQLASCMAQGHCHFKIKKETIPLLFIRAPRLTILSKEIDVLVSYQNEPVCVQKNACLAATFHPELTQDLTLHQHFLKLLK